MGDPLSLSISAASFAISAITAWLTLFRSGELKMTIPALFYLGSDGMATNIEEGGSAKVFLRAFLVRLCEAQARRIPQLPCRAMAAIVDGSVGVPAPGRGQHVRVGLGTQEPVPRVGGGSVRLLSGLCQRPARALAEAPSRQ